MPFLAPIFVAIGFSAATAASISVFVISTVASLAIGQVARLFRKKPGASSLAASGGSAGRSITSRQAAAARRVLFGKHGRLGGVITFMCTQSNGAVANAWLDLIITLTGHQVNAITKVFADGVEVPLDGAGDATGHYAGHIHVNKNLGTRDQAAFGYILGIGGYTSAHRQRGCAGVLIQVQANPTLFPNGLPNFTFEVEGALVYDPRNGTIAYSANAALCSAEYLTNATWGLGAQTKAGISSGQLSHSGMGSFSAAACVDDNLAADCWNTDAASSGAFVKLDLGAGVTAEYRRLRLYMDAAGCAANYTVEWSDNDSAWNTAASSCIPDLVGWNEWDLAPNGSHRYWRLRLTNTPGAGPDVRELQFWSSDVDTATLITAANLCDENVSLAAGGTEDRYTCNGTFDTSELPSEVLPRINSSMAGFCVYIAGKWGIYPGAWRASSLSLGDADLRGPLSVQTRVAHADLFNGVKGIFVSPSNDWQLSDFPPYASAAYRAEDGNEALWLDLEYPFTISGATVQRLSKITLQRRRRQISFPGQFKLTAYQVQPMDIIQFTHARFGWTNKTFEVMACSLVYEESGEGEAQPVGVNLALREADATIYDWSTAEEGALNVPPTPTLPDPATCAAPTNLALQSAEIVRAADGIRSVGILVTWTAPADEFVKTGGRVIVQYKKTADTNWVTNTEAQGDAVEAVIPPLLDGTQYDVRLWAENIYGVKSSVVSSTHTPSSSGATIELIADGGGYVRGTQYSGSEIVVENANFEASSALPPPGWEAENAAGPAVAYETSTQHSGTRSLKVTQAGGYSYVLSVRKYKVVPGEIYKISAWAKVASGGVAVALIHFYDAADSFISYVAAGSTNSTSWVLLTNPALGTVPANSVYMRIALQAFNATFAAYFDSVHIKRLTDNVDEIAGKSVELVRNPNFESGDRDWSKGTGWTIEASNPYDGLYAGKYSGAADAALTNDIYIAVQEGQKLYGSCMIKKASGTATPCVAIEWFDSAKASISTSLGLTITSGTFSKSEVVATAPATAFFAKIKAQSQATVSAVIYVDQFDASRAYSDPVSATATTSAPTTTSVTFADIAEMSVNLGTHGGKVLLNFTGSFTMTGANLGLIRFTRDGTEIGQRAIVQNGAVYTQIAMVHIDATTVGAHTYAVQWAVQVAAQTLAATTTLREFQATEI